MRRRCVVITLVVACLALAVGSRGDAPPTPAASMPPLPVAGDVIAAFDAEGLDGVVQHIAFDKTKVLLFFLSGCPTCHKMIPEWNRKYAARPKGLEIVGILMDREPPGFFSTMPIAFPVVRSPGLEFARKLKLNRVPLTVRVGPRGVVEDVGMGMLDPIRLGQLIH